MKEENFIDISGHDEKEDLRPVEIPEITIGSQPYGEEPADPPRKKPLWVRVTLIAMASIAAILIVWAALWYRDRHRPPVEASVTDEQNIAWLSAPAKPSAAKGVETVSDSILGVAFTAYPLDGLRGSLEEAIPDTADRSVVLMMRSADYYPDGTMIGTLVAQGKKSPARERRSRAAYLALSKEGKTAIGVSLSDKMPDHLEETGGSFFRQFPLLGNGDLPSKFELHGKVERGAIGRMADGKLYYFLTRDRESMYDFADALREYGVMDAVYITGGDGYRFHRDTNGDAHVSPQLREHYAKYPDKTPAPMLVFRTH